MPIPGVHELGARVLAQIPGSQPFEGVIRGYGGGKEMRFDCRSEVQPVDAPLCLIRELVPQQVRRIVQANVPGGDTIVGTIGATIRDFDENFTGYTVSYLYAPTIGERVAPEWLEPLQG